MPDSGEQPDRIEARMGAEFILPHFEARALAKERQKGLRGSAILCLCLVVLGTVLIEPLVVRSELITPLSGYVLWPMRLFGLLTGLSIALASFEATQVDWKGWLNRAVLLVCSCGLGMAAFDALTWRAARWYEFGLSNQPFVAKTYVLSLNSYGRYVHKARVRLDPFETGQPLVIHVPPHQLGAWEWSGKPLCITVMQRQSRTGAVEVKTEAWRPFRTPVPKPIEPCATMSD